MQKFELIDITVKDNGVFPNSNLPVLHYKHALKLPRLFPSRAIKKIFQKNDWTNNWRNGIYTYNHYHSNTHETFAVVKGKTCLLLGGENGIRIRIQKGDIVVIPAGVAHRNEGKEKDVICVGGYPGGKDFDMNYGHAQERPLSDKNIASVPLPATGPLEGQADPLLKAWCSEMPRVINMNDREARSGRIG